MSVCLSSRGKRCLCVSALGAKDVCVSQSEKQNLKHNELNYFSCGMQICSQIQVLLLKFSTSRRASFRLLVARHENFCLFEAFFRKLKVNVIYEQCNGCYVPQCTMHTEFSFKLVTEFVDQRY